MLLMKRMFLLFVLGLFLVGCKQADPVIDDIDDDKDDVVVTCTLPKVLEDGVCVNPEVEVPTGVESVLGLEDTEVIRNHYFNPIKDVELISDLGSDITHLVNVSGNVDYGTLGSYTLTYTLETDESTFSEERVVTVVDGTYVSPTGSRPLGSNESIDLESGSYLTGTDGTIDHPPSPGYIENDLLDTAVPSNGWWTSLLVANGGAGNGIYTNPLRFAFDGQGMEITNPGDGFVQYWTPNGDQTMAQFPISLKDMYLMTSDLSSSYQTQVIDYGESNVKVAMRNAGSNEDKMVVSLVQGSPYAFVEVANKTAPYLKLDVNGNTGYKYYQVDGTLITGNSYVGDGIIVELTQRHVGYDTFLPANVGAPQFEDRFFLINTPINTTFTISSEGHPFGGLNKLAMSLGNGNYFSVSAIPTVSEGTYYHEHGYQFINDSSANFSIDYVDSEVHTTYTVSTQAMRDDLSDSPILALMPHHYKYSDAVLSDYSIRTVRGTLKLLESDTFDTVLPFYGLLPGYTLPSNDAFSSTVQVEYLEDLLTRTDVFDTENFINEDGPYWNGKASYPLAQGIMIADQLGETTLRDSLILNLKYNLEDWYTYSSSSDDKFLYYNQSWGSTYYSNDDFGTASALSDHNFTHGYMIYASSVLAMYDADFVAEYGDMVDLLVNDYMYPEKDSSEFEYIRSFDAWAGHSWAHGFGTFAEGNNMESTSESLNSWNAGYLWALATGDIERMEVAIYGFATELSAVKEYWFDYDEENWDPAFGDYVDVAGMVWGGKHDYATWFGANPTFIYGIQWLPTGEYLTNYAMTDEEYTKMSSIYATYLAAKNGTIDTWYSNMWAIQAIIDPTVALSEFDKDLILNDDYPAELSGTYWMINALDTLNRRTTDVWMELEMGVSSTVYEAEDGTYYAMIWNVSDESRTINFYNDSGLFTTETVEANSFTKLELN